MEKAKWEATDGRSLDGKHLIVCDVSIFLPLMARGRGLERV